MTEIQRDPTGGEVDFSEAEGKLRHQVRGLPVEKAMELFGTLCGWGFAASLKHLGGWYFVEVPVGLQGDPCYGEAPRIQTLAFRAGCKTIQTGQTLRIIG